jgi:hypothetical protein
MVIVYKILEQIEHDQFYDIAYVRVGFVDDDGVLMKLPVPKELNTQQLDDMLTAELNKLTTYFVEHPRVKEQFYSKC